MRSYGSILRLFPVPAFIKEAAVWPPPPSLAEEAAERQLPHLLVLVFQLPHLWVTQSPTRSREPSSSLDHAAPGTSPSVFHTTSNWPSPRTSPMNTGLVIWWLGSILEMPPVRFGASMPGSASITLSGSVVFAFSTALTHMAKPITCASIGSLVTRFGFLVNSFHFAMNSLFAGVSIDWK